MSRYIQILNSIKQNIQRIALTRSQFYCREIILERLVYPGIINLYGGRGAGKTLLGWRLDSERSVEYLNNPEQVYKLDFGTVLYLDNSGCRHDDFRQILDRLNHRRINKAVVVTNERIDDFTFSNYLDCTAEDIEIAKDNFQLLGFLPSNWTFENPMSNCWDLLQNCVGRYIHAN